MARRSVVVLFTAISFGVQYKYLINIAGGFGINEDSEQAKLDLENIADIIDD